MSVAKTRGSCSLMDRKPQDLVFTHSLCLCLFRFLSGVGLSSVPRLVGESRDEDSVWRLSESQQETFIDLRLKDSGKISDCDLI